MHIHIVTRFLGKVYGKTALAVDGYYIIASLYAEMRRLMTAASEAGIFQPRLYFFERGFLYAGDIRARYLQPLRYLALCYRGFAGEPVAQDDDGALALVEFVCDYAQSLGSRYLRVEVLGYIVVYFDDIDICERIAVLIRIYRVIDILDE